MKLHLTLLVLFFIVLIPIRGAPQSVDEQAITSACFDKFIKDLDVLTQNYKRKELEVDKDESLKKDGSPKNIPADYKQKLYEYMIVKDVKMRRLVGSNKTIHDSEKEFRPYERDFNIDNSFFDRFEYNFKKRTIRDGVSVLIFQFSPKANLKENHSFDRVVNKLIGELEVRESDNAFLAFKARLPPGIEVEFGSPPLAGVNIQKTIILVETTDREGLILPSNVRIDVNYSASFLLGTAYSKHTKTIELKDIEKIKKENPNPQPSVSSKISKDHELSNLTSTTKKLVIVLGIAVLVAVSLFVLFSIFKKKK